MLVQFMLKNVLSFKEETVLDMTAINAYKEHPGNLIDIGTAEKFLKVAAIYGAECKWKIESAYGNVLFSIYYYRIF